MTSATMLFFDGKWISSASPTLMASVGEAHLLSAFVDPTTFVGWGYPNVFNLGDRFRMLYQGWSSHPGNVERSYAPRLVLAADSADGVFWEPVNVSRPAPPGWQDIWTWPSNAVWGPTQGLSWVYDDGCGLWRNCSSDERLKAIVKEGATLHALTSDGLSGWNHSFGKWSRETVDPGIAAFRNPLNDSEVVLTGRPQALRWSSGRHAGRSFADGWKGLNMSLLTPTLPLDRLFAPNQQMYGIPSFAYGGMVVSFWWRLQCTAMQGPMGQCAVDAKTHETKACGDDCGMVDAALAFSYNSRNWSAFGQTADSNCNSTFMPLFPNVGGREDAGQVYPNTLIEAGGRLLVHASAATGLHGASTVGAGNSSLLTFELRYDGFVYLAATNGSASFETVVVRWHGGDLLINADTSANASSQISVAVLDGGTGSELTGFGATNSMPFCGKNETAQVWSWSAGGMDRLSGKNVALKVFLWGAARLYSIRGRFEAV